MIHPSVIRKQKILILSLLALIFCTIIASLGLGYSPVSYDRILPVLLGQGTFKEEFVLMSVRLPRIVITLLAGIALAASGAILQGLTRNELADPGIIGINSGAGVGVAVFFLFFSIDAGSFAYMLPIAGFLGALLTACCIYLFSYEKGIGLQPTRMILVGIGFSMALSGAMIVIISSAEPQKVDFIAKWLAGNIWGADWPFVLALLPWVIVLVPFILYKANRLNLLHLGDPVSIGVGVSVAKERLVLLLVAVALAAAAVSVTGGIAFIGLMAPHLARLLIGPRNQLALPLAMLIGGWLLLFADTIGRNIVEPDGIAAGIMSALIGAPFFVYLLMKK
ncbi:FecCD family ABC transporter permease [Mesobacillus zeae]|uniref:Iron ABC transporter permease n=1 Tax=Mesobacillus zeae TaxID=1917180 RepID=A0A398AY23_9BACI|nr:iron ABC transporter permease [Mesobacillus zeae]RID82517.1 iron ABC transporter permease [Mesobacillus zeae]